MNTQKKKFELYKGPKPRSQPQEQITTNHQENLKVEQDKIEPSLSHPEEQLLQTAINEEYHSQDLIDEHEEHHSDTHIDEHALDDHMNEHEEHHSDTLIDEHHSDVHIDERDEPHTDAHIDELEENGVTHQDKDEGEEIAERSEHEISADELDDNNQTSADVDEEEIVRPESISIPNGHDQLLVESNTSSPIEEIKSPLSPDDLMNKSFMDGDTRRENPFLEKTNDTDTDDEMEIIHHDVLTSNPHSPPSVEEIHPQGLPIANQTSSSSKSLNKTFNR